MQVHSKSEVLWKQAYVRVSGDVGDNENDEQVR